MKSTGQSIFLRGIFLRPVSLVFVLGMFVAGASPQMTRHASVAPGTSDFGLTKKHDGGKTQLAAGAGTSVPVAAQPGISGALGHDDFRYEARAVGDGLRAENPQQGLTTEFTRRGIEVRSGAAHWGLTFHGYGYGDALRVASPAAPQGSANRVEYRRGALTEWYVNGPLGMEQGFTLAARPAQNSGQPLTIALELSRGLSASVDPGGKGVTVTQRDGEARLRYAGLVAYDATGRELRSWLEARDNGLLLRVEDAGAPYPLVVDPFIQAAKLTASDGVYGDEFGSSEAMSSDGSTVVIGAPDVPSFGSSTVPGAAYVFVKPASGWTTTSTFTAKLTASDGVAGDQLGYSVAISGDGGTVVAGVPVAKVGSNVEQGAAYVFVKPASGWATATETARLTASDGAAVDELGYSVAMSSDGGTVVAGAIGFNSEQGAVYVFPKPASGWATTSSFAAKLTASDGVARDWFGFTVAVDGAGSTVLVTKTTYSTQSSEPATIYVFVKPTGGWASTSNFNAKLTASDAASSSSAFSLALSSDGGTVVLGAFDVVVQNVPTGAAYVFVKPASGWVTTTETATLTASEATIDAHFGVSVAVSADGGAVMVGAPLAPLIYSQEGAAYEFLRPATGWATTSTFTVKLGAADETPADAFGSAVAISGDGSAMLVAGPFAAVGSNNSQGAAYVFVSDGSGLPAANLTPTNLNFGNQDVNTTSRPRTVTLTNTGSGPLQITGMSIGDSLGGGQFATTTNCLTASILQPGASCSESITFTPKVASYINGLVVFIDNSVNADGSQQSVSLSGTGLDFTMSAAPASQSVLPGQSAKYTITLTTVKGLTETVTMGCSGGPPGATCVLSPSAAVLSGTATITATVTVPRTAKKRTSTITFTATSGLLTLAKTVKLTVN